MQRQMTLNWKQHLINAPFINKFSSSCMDFSCESCLQFIMFLSFRAMFYGTSVQSIPMKTNKWYCCAFWTLSLCIKLQVDLRFFITVNIVLRKSHVTFFLWNIEGWLVTWKDFALYQLFRCSWARSVRVVRVDFNEAEQ